MHVQMALQHFMMGVQAWSGAKAFSDSVQAIAHSSCAVALHSLCVCCLEATLLHIPGTAWNVSLLANDVALQA